MKKEKQKTREEDIEYLDKMFPKGESKLRGEAMVLLALARKEGKHQFDNQIEAIKDVAEQIGFNKGIQQGKKMILKEVEDTINKMLAEGLDGKRQNFMINGEELKAKLQDKGK